VTRGPSQGGLPGRIAQVDYRAINLGNLDVAGFDWDLHWKFDTSLGEWTPALRATEIYRYDAVLAPNAGTVDYLAKANTDVWSPRWRGSASLNWKYRSLSAVATGRYVSGYRDYSPLATGEFQHLGDFWTTDVNFSFALGQSYRFQRAGLKDLAISVGAVDLFDVRVPYSTYSVGGYDPSQYDIRGRSAYLQLSTRF
jgi:iron complex outermembrane receptor protein